MGKYAKNGNRLYPRISTDNRWWLFLRLLSVTNSVMRLTRLLRNSIPSLLIAPMVLAASAMNKYICVNGVYLAVLLIIVNDKGWLQYAMILNKTTVPHTCVMSQRSETGQRITRQRRPHQVG